MNFKPEKTDWEKMDKILPSTKFATQKLGFFNTADRQQEVKPIPMSWQVRTKVQAMLELQTDGQPASSWRKSLLADVCCFR